VDAIVSRAIERHSINARAVSSMTRCASPNGSRSVVLDGLSSVFAMTPDAHDLTLCPYAASVATPDGQCGVNGSGLLARGDYAQHESSVAICQRLIRRLCHS
jgi:hypothetical protein